MSAVFFVDKKIRKIYAKNTFKIIKLLIVMSSYYISNRKVANFARSLAVKDWFWDNSFMLWLRKEVLELSQVEASKYVASCDSSELTDFDELDRLAAFYKTSYLSGLKVSSIQPGLRDSFVKSYLAYEDACARLERLQRQGFWFRFKYRKVLREARAQCNELDKEYSLDELVAIACSFYVEQGKGDIKAANKYFLG